MPKLHEYQILEKMATGSFGVVFRIRHILDDKILVMKRIPLEGLTHKERREAAQEIFVMNKLSHPYIVAQRDAFLFNDNDLCIVMDYYDGGDIDLLVSRQREKDEYLPLREVMLYFVEMLLGVNYLHHQNIVHRDIKSHNIFIDRHNDCVAVGDFGIAETIDPNMLTWRNSMRRLNSASTMSRNRMSRLNSDAAPVPLSPLSVSRGGDTFSANPLDQHDDFLKGTPMYMPPETLQGGPAGPKADVWALGCILYELLCLRHPFQTNDLATLVLRVSRGEREPIPAHYPTCIKELINALLETDLAKRPSSDEVLRVPCVRAYIELLLSLRVPSDGPQTNEEKSFMAQVSELEAPTIHHSQVEKELREPLRLPSVDREEANRRAAEASATYSRMTPNSSISSMGIGASAGTFFVAGSQTPFPVYVSKEQSPIQMNSPLGMEPTASMKPYMLQDVVRTDSNMHRVSQSSESHFFAQYPNVADMNGMPTEAIAEEVWRLRLFLQLVSQSKQRQKDSDALYERYGSGMQSTLPDAYKYRSHREIGEKGEQRRGSGLEDTERLLTTPKHPKSLSAYAERRQKLVKSILKKLNPNVFAAVYSYYRDNDVVHRDPAVVMGWVPQREQWPVLPLVEQVLVLDRFLSKSNA